MDPELEGLGRGFAYFETGFDGFASEAAIDGRIHILDDYR